MAVKPDYVEDPNCKFTLVSGPEGSGKAFFSLWFLHKLVFPNAVDEKELFRVQFTVRAADSRMKHNQRTFPDTVTTMVEEAISAKRKSGEESQGVTTKVELYLHVILSGGSESFKKHFDTDAKLNRIVATLEEKMAYRFVKGVHVTITGSALTKVTADIMEGTKFVMQPWTLENFDAMVDASDHVNKEKVKEAIRIYRSVFQYLLTNAQQAVMLFEIIKDMVSESQKHQLENFINLLATIVFRREDDDVYE